MVWIIAINVAAGTVLILLWYAWFARVNRRKSAEVLRRIKTAFAGHVQIVGVRWSGASRLLIRLRVLSSLFQHASMMVQLHERQVPAKWLYSRLKNRQETLTFEADLECPPAFNLEVHNQRWCGHTRGTRQQPTMTMERCGPFVLTTRHDWQRDITTMMTALVASRDCDFLTVSFRRVSPHFSATVPLVSLWRDPQAEAEIFEVLRELASCAQTSHF
jgi:uncharacterized paraquat-inducible protein A